MNAAATITTAFAAHQDRLAAEAVESMRSVLSDMKSEHGPSLDCIYSSRDYSLWVTTLRRLCERIGATFDEIGRPVGGCWELSAEKATAWAAAWAAAELKAAANKLIAKVGDLSNVKIVGEIEHGRFTLTGAHPSGAVVRVEQTRILNVSSKGTMFSQWPARIYVDGKFVSEADYKRISPRPEDRVLPEINL